MNYVRPGGQRHGSEQANGANKSGFESNAKTVDVQNPSQCGVTLKIRLGRRQCQLSCHKKRRHFVTLSAIYLLFRFWKKSRVNSGAKLKTPLRTLCAGNPNLCNSV